MNRLITIPEYWALPENERPETFEELVEMFIHRPEISGFWRITGTDNRTGEIISEIWTPNAITDNGAQAAISNTFAASGGAITPFNVMCISTEAGSTSLTTALTATVGVTALAVSALPAAIPASTVLKVDYSTGSEETCTSQAGSTALGATSIPLTGTFTPAFSHAIGKTVVPVALVTDNPSGTPTGGVYLSLVGGDYGAVSGSGVGNRTRTITKKFPGASTTAGTYTWARLCNANPIVSGSVGASCIVPQCVINSTTDQTFAVVIKL